MFGEYLAKTLDHKGVMEQLLALVLVRFQQSRIVHLPGKNARDIAGVPHQMADFDQA